MALQSHAALAEIRDTLLETYASNDAMNQLILSHLDPRAWRAQPPGQKGSGRTIAAIFAHLHNVRCKWVRLTAHHRGQILMLAHQLGYRAHKAMYGIWHWEKLWKQAGFTTRPR